MGNQVLSDIHNIDRKRSFVQKYIDKVNQLEQLHLMTYLEPHKAKADELLHTLSCFSNTSDAHQEWKGFLEETEKKVLNGHITFERYINHVNRLEQHVRLEQQKARFDTLLQNPSHFHNVVENIRNSFDT